MVVDKFLKTVKEYQLFSPGDLVLVAVSGGVDSTALLHLLYSQKELLGISLHVAHLNHMLRKGEAELDAKFVESMAQKLGIPVTVEAVDVNKLADERKMSIEEAAREARYGFFEKLVEKIGAQKIAVGHTADDNVETFLMRLLRGTGLRGLCGIPPKRGKIVRPLIKIWRRELEEYVGGLKLVPRRDHTNYESKYLRNSVRLKLLPQLKIYNLNIKEIILQTIFLLTEDYFYLEDQAEEVLDKILISQTEEEIKLDLNKFRSINPTIQKYVLRLAIERIKGDVKQLTFGHISSILEKIYSTEKWELHLPGTLFVSGGRENLVFSLEKPTLFDSFSYRYLLPIPGEVEIQELGKRVRSSFVEKVDKENNRDAFVDYDILGKEVVVRSKSPGDRFCPLGMKGSKKLQDFFIDEKVPLEERNKIPIVESGGKIIWVAGMRIDDQAKVTNKTKKIVKFELL